MYALTDSYTPEYYWTGAIVMDLDQDGNNSIFVMDWGSSYTGALWKVEWTGSSWDFTKMYNGLGAALDHGLTKCDIDNDGADELILASGYGNSKTGKVYVVENGSEELKAIFAPADHNNFYGIQCADFKGNGKKQLIAWSPYTTPFDRIYIIDYNDSTGWYDNQTIYFDTLPGIALATAAENIEDESSSKKLFYMIEENTDPVHMFRFEWNGTGMNKTTLITFPSQFTFSYNLWKAASNVMYQQNTSMYFAGHNKTYGPALVRVWVNQSNTSQYLWEVIDQFSGSDGYEDRFVGDIDDRGIEQLYVAQRTPHRPWVVQYTNQTEGQNNITVCATDATVYTNSTPV